MDEKKDQSIHTKGRSAFRCRTAFGVYARSGIRKNNRLSIYQGREIQMAMNPEAAIQKVVFRRGKPDRPDRDENFAILEL
jgi:hypothetical protein